MILRPLASTSRSITLCCRQFASRTSPYDDPNYAPKDAPLVDEEEPQSQLARLRKTAEKITNLSDYLKPQNELWTANYPGPRGVVEVDREIPFKTRWFDGVKLMARYAKEWIAENKAAYFTNDVTHNHLPIHDKEIRTFYNFAEPDSMKSWQHGCDSYTDEGYSTCDWRRTERGTALFTGLLDTTVPNTGAIRQAGWAAIKTKNRVKSGGRKEYWWDELTGFTHFVVRCRGDGRTWLINLSTIDDVMDNTWGDMYTYALYTHGGPYWQTYTVPFSKFYKSAAGKISRQGRGITSAFDVRSFGFTLMDKRDGEFSLEVDYIGAMYDKAHFEEFAYEFYSFPTGVAAFTRD